MPTSILNERTGGVATIGSADFFHPILSDTELRLEEDGFVTVGREPVGGAHARITWLAGEWTVAPVPALDRPVHVEPAVLTGGSAIDLGDTRLVFHTQPRAPHLLREPPLESFEAHLTALEDPPVEVANVHAMRISAMFALLAIAADDPAKRERVRDAFLRSSRIYGEGAVLDALRMQGLAMLARTGAFDGAELRRLLERPLTGWDVRLAALAARLLARTDPLTWAPELLARLRRTQQSEINEQRTETTVGLLATGERDAILEAVTLLTAVVHDAHSVARRRWAATNLGVLARGGVGEARRVLESLLGQAVKPWAACELALLRHAEATEIARTLVLVRRREIRDAAVRVLATSDDPELPDLAQHLEPPVVPAHVIPTPRARI